MADQPRKQNADTQFKKLQRAEDGKKAMLDYEAAAAAVRAKTERLRALRLAREAELKAAAPPPAPPKAKRATKKTKEAAGGNLAEWLNDRERSGHKN